MLELLKEYALAITGVTIVLFVGGLWLVGWVIARLPEDYFLQRERRPENPHGEPGTATVRSLASRMLLPTVRTGWWILRNVLGLALLTIGIVFIVSPGPAILTLLLGLSLIDAPWKRRALNGLLRRHAVQDSLNWIREQAGRPPLRFPEECRRRT